MYIRRFSVCVRACVQRWQKHSYDLHKKRLHDMKHRIDMEEPETGKIKIGRANNPKRAQQEANRQGEIDLENQVLLDKLVRIKQFDSSKIFKPWLGRSTFQYKCVARAVNRGAGVGGVQYGIAVVGRLPACPTPLSLQYTLALPPEFYMACTESRLAVPPPPSPPLRNGLYYDVASGIRCVDHYNPTAHSSPRSTTYYDLRPASAPSFRAQQAYLTLLEEVSSRRGGRE